MALAGSGHRVIRLRARSVPALPHRRVAAGHRSTTCLDAIGAGELVRADGLSRRSGARPSRPPTAHRSLRRLLGVAPASRRRRPGRCRGHVRPPAARATRPERRRRASNGIACRRGLRSPRGVTRAVQRRRGGPAPQRSRARAMIDAIGPRRPALAPAQPANRRTAARQRRRLLRTTPACRAAQARRAGRHPHRRAGRPRVVLADSDLRRTDERRRRAAAIRRPRAAGDASPACCSIGRSRTRRRWRDCSRSAQREWPVRVEKDFSFGSRAYAGDRWVLAGDAGSFLDPVFSTGVAIALESGLEAAQAVAGGLAAGDLLGPALPPLRAASSPALPRLPALRARVLHAGVPLSVLRRGAAPPDVPLAHHGLRRLLAPAARDAHLGRALLPAGSAATVGAVRAAARVEPHGDP